MKLDNIVKEDWGNEETLYIRGYGRLSVRRAERKLNEYLHHLAESAERAVEDKGEYSHINAILRNGVVSALADALANHFDNR